MKILLLANTSFKLVNFRSSLIGALIAEGHELVAAAPRDSQTPRLEALGVRVIELPMDATGTSPPQEAALLGRIFRLIRAERPDAILGFTIKPNIYGALSARVLGIPFLPNVTGLGTAFDREGWLSQLVRKMYRTAFKRCPRVFLQNPEDRDLFVRTGLARTDQTELLPGSGVDLAAFRARPLPGRGQEVTFLLVARMLRDKGVVEFAEAARLLASDYPRARFQLLGPLGTGKAGGLESNDIAGLCADSPLIHLGAVEDVRPIFAKADCVVLPSFYREGTPRSLLEAGAMGRPVITTDMPGCRDVVEDGISGFLCRPRDSVNLASAMRKFLKMDDNARAVMGKAARLRMEKYFDEALVIQAYRHALGDVPR